MEIDVLKLKSIQEYHCVPIQLWAKTMSSVELISSIDACAAGKDEPARVAFYCNIMNAVIDRYLDAAKAMIRPDTFKNEQDQFLQSTKCVETLNELTKILDGGNLRAGAVRVAATAIQQSSGQVLDALIKNVNGRADENKAAPKQWAAGAGDLIVQKPVAPFPIMKAPSAQAKTITISLVEEPTANGPQRFLIINNRRFTAGPSEFVVEKFKVARCNAPQCNNANCSYYHDPLTHRYRHDFTRKLHISWIGHQTRQVLATAALINDAHVNGQIDNDFIRDVAAISGGYLCRLIMMMPWMT